MNAIELLESQHREVEDLFEKIEKASDEGMKLELFNTLADKLSVHCAIEEKIFYPAIKAKQTEDLLGEAVQEHLQAKRMIVDILNGGASEEFEAQCKVLKEEIEHHVEEEEEELFPKCEGLLGAEILEALGQEMTSLMSQLEEQGEPRKAVFAELEEAAKV